MRYQKGVMSSAKWVLMSFLFCPSIRRVMQITIRVSRWAIIFSIAGTLIGCNPWTAWSQQGADQGERSVSVLAIASLSTEQSGKSIQIQGKVSQSAPFVDGGAYQIQDPTGKIWVITDQKLPTNGVEILVEGQLNFHDLSLGTNDFGEFFITEQQVLPASSSQEINQSSTNPPVVVLPTEIPEQPVSPESQPQKLNLDVFLLPHKENSK